MTTTRTSCAAVLLAALFLLPSSPVSAQTYGQPTAAWRAPRPHQAPRPTEPEGPSTSWDPLRFEVALETRTTWLQDDAAKRLAGKRAPVAGGLSLQADVLRPSDKLTVRLDLGWITTSSTIPDYTALSERLDSNAISLGLGVRYDLLRWLAPFARLAGGVGWDKVSLGSGGTNNLHDREVFGQGSAGAGVLLRSPGLRFWQSPAAPFFGLVGQIEGGYYLGTSSDFSLQSSPAGSGSGSIPTSAVAIGRVGRGAPYLRVSFGIAF